MTQAPPTPLSRLRKPRQFSQAELDKLFPVDCKIDAKGNVTVSRTWEQTNLVKVKYPDSFGMISPFWMHKDAAGPFKKWFALISKEKLNTRFMTHNGSYVPRIMRIAAAAGEKSKAKLSRHTRGIALDINYGWNKQGMKPAALGEVGCILELVPLANECGIVAGADFRGEYVDGCHFELGTFDP